MDCHIDIGLDAHLKNCCCKLSAVQWCNSQGARKQGSEIYYLSKITADLQIIVIFNLRTAVHYDKMVKSEMTSRSNPQSLSNVFLNTFEQLAIKTQSHETLRKAGRVCYLLYILINK
jgi:hypothetical protein